MLPPDAQLGDPVSFGSSRDEAQVREWWKRFPRAMVGVRTGKVNGLTVVDIDKHGTSDGFQSLKDFPDLDPKKTATTLTAGGGQHQYSPTLARSNRLFWRPASTFWPTTGWSSRPAACAPTASRICWSTVAI